MRALAILLLFGSSLLPAAAQDRVERGASESETRAVADMVDCLVAGLPEDWYAASMQINLDKPMDKTGAVRYLMSRDEQIAPAEPFQPCDVKKPPQLLLGLRDSLPKDKRGWIGAEVRILRDGRYGIRYGYPKPAPKPKP
jgi:hypothetical protein